MQESYKRVGQTPCSRRGFADRAQDQGHAAIGCPIEDERFFAGDRVAVESSVAEPDPIGLVDHGHDPDRLTDLHRADAEYEGVVLSDFYPVLARHRLDGEATAGLDPPSHEDPDQVVPRVRSCGEFGATFEAAVTGQCGRPSVGRRCCAARRAIVQVPDRMRVHSRERTQHHLAVPIGVPSRRINEIVHGKRRITADTALRLARYFGTSDRFWTNLQSRYDLEIERDQIGEALEAITPLAGV